MKNIEKLFQLSRERQERKKQAQKRKIKKIQDETRKLLLKKTKKEKALEKKKQLEKEKQNLLLTQAKRVFNVYLKHTKLLKRNTAEDDLYLTREELQEAEKRGEGHINWNVWDSLVNKFREQNEQK